VGSFPHGDVTIGTGIVGAPACGDVMKLQIKVEEGIIVDARFKSFEFNFLSTEFCSTCSYNLNKDKEIKLNFSQVLFPAQIEIDNMKALNASTNSTGDEYNLKVSFD
jgi:hypothetical protein